MKVVELIRINDAKEFEAFFEEVLLWYSTMLFNSKEVTDKSIAYEQSYAVMSKFFPNKTLCEAHYVFNICDIFLKAMLGYLWIFIPDEGATMTVARVAYIGINPKWRRQGYAKSTLLKAEDFITKRLKLNRASLNVFAISTYAKQLYESLGYSVIREKHLGLHNIITRYEMEKCFIPNEK
jgi:ribosomal protein S18 acetylase RimI-like enzyme